MNNNNNLKHKIQFSHVKLKLLGFPLVRKSVSIGSIISMEYEHSLGYWKVRKFTGRCLGLKKKLDGHRFLLRNIINGIGIDFSFIGGSHLIVKLTELPATNIKFRRAKLYFLRSSKLKLVRL